MYKKNVAAQVEAILMTCFQLYSTFLGLHTESWIGLQSMKVL